MEIAIGTIVRSTAGRDKGKSFYVLAAENDFVLLVDGKRRRLEHPKRKRVRHVAVWNVGQNAAADKLANGEKITNSELRKAIAALDGENPNREES